jgi:predicted nuclease of predicted toxin-antitoxin system
MQIAIAPQLRAKGIEVVTVKDLNLLGESDINHLRNATQMGYVLCTHDKDYLQLAFEGVEHSGIVIGKWLKHSIGDWVHALILIYDVLQPQDMINNIEYL